MSQWLRIWASTAGDSGSIPGWGTKILYTEGCGQKIKKKKKETVVTLCRWGWKLRVSQVAVVVKNLPASAGDVKRHRFDPWVKKIP